MKILVIPADRESPAVAPAVVPGDSGENCELKVLMPSADRESPALAPAVVPGEKKVMRRDIDLDGDRYILEREYLGLSIQARNNNHGWRG